MPASLKGGEAKLLLVPEASEADKVMGECPARANAAIFGSDNVVVKDEEAVPTLYARHPLMCALVAMATVAATRNPTGRREESKVPTDWAVGFCRRFVRHWLRRDGDAW
jgi:hypothetical protein